MIDLPATDSIPSKTNPLTLYLARLAPSSQLTMRYVLQDAADRLGFEDMNVEEIPWH
ncbi:MAG: integrase, partial [Pseudomonas sp.]